MPGGCQFVHVALPTLPEKVARSSGAPCFSTKHGKAKAGDVEGVGWADEQARALAWMEGKGHGHYIVNMN